MSPVKQVAQIVQKKNKEMEAKRQEKGKKRRLKFKEEGLFWAQW